MAYVSGSSHMGVERIHRRRNSGPQASGSLCCYLGNAVCIAATMIAVLASGCSLFAQTEFDEVHITPRTKNVSVKGSNSDSSVLRSNVNLVQVSVSVLDHDDHAVEGLQVSNFIVFDDKVPQSIRYFSQEDAPLSVVVVLDTSGSMAPKMDSARHAAIEFLNGCNVNDEISVITVASTPRLKNIFSDSMEEIRETINVAQADGTTSLWDSVYLGIQELRSARLPRKAMVIISDGGDNASRFTEASLRRLLQESSVQVYGIGFFESFPRTQEEKGGSRWLDDITNVTGGRLFTAHDDADASRAATQVSRELRNEYILSYYANYPERNGKWRNIKVKLTAAPSDKFHLYAKKGYYSPID
jgi:Ca-activated chloride channel family protein